MNGYKLHVLSGDYTLNNNKILYKNAYIYWREVWKAEWQEMGVKKDLNSDHFTRQDYIFVITKQDEIAGLLFLKKYATLNPLLFEDSVFSYSVPSKFKKAMKSKGADIHITSSLTIRKKFRKNLIAFYLTACLVKCIQEQQDIHHIFATARIKERIDDLANFFNAKQMGEPINVDFGQPQSELSALVVFDKNCYIPTKIIKSFSNIWAEKNEISYSTSFRNSSISI